MTNNQLTEIAKIIGVSEDSISAMDDEIRNSMTAVLETTKDKKAVYDTLDDLWQKGSVYVELHEVSKATGILLKATFGDVPLVQSMIKRNEQRIRAIRSEKIPNRTQKLVNCENKIEQLTAKRDRISHKLNRVIALNDTIKSFSIGLNKERREAFSEETLTAAHQVETLDKEKITQLKILRK